MYRMFHVRSARALPPSFESIPPPVMPLAPLPPESLSPSGPHLAPHRMPSFRLGSSRRRSTSR
eukprot:scaffold30426_cov61-Phaeocystis_antarctica.AAC.4